MNKSRLIAQIKKGYYLVPQKIPPDGMWSPSIYIAMAEYLKIVGASKYQITGARAFNTLGLSQQMAQSFTVYNDKISGEKNIAGYQIQFIKISKKRLGFIIKYEVNEPGFKGVAIYSSLPRLIFDAIYDYNRFNTIPKAYNWLKTYSKNNTFLKEFVKITLTLGNIGTKKRIGYLLEEYGCKSSYYLKIYQSLTPIE